MDKGFWMLKNGGHLNEGETVFRDSSGENKRLHQWISEAEEPELFPSNKKQTVEIPARKQNPGLSMANNTLSWEINSDFQSSQNPFIDQLFNSDVNSSVNFSGQSMNQLAAESSELRKKFIHEEFGDGASVGLSMSYPLEETEAYGSFGGIRKLKVNHVKDSENGLNAAMSLNQAYNRETETAFMSMGQAYGKEGEKVSFDATSLRPLESTYSKGDENAKAVGDSSSVSFGGYQDDRFIEAFSSPVSSYDLLYNTPLQPTETICAKETDGSNGGAAVVTTTTTIPTVQATTKSKPEPAGKPKPSKREAAPNSFPSNVRSLMATVMLDGVPVRYVSSQEEHRGMIKGSGYLSGCENCNYSKALSAYEFECHAGCKTKHPNNHIYFENGKTIYQVVQELRSTPESQLFDAIQTVIGSPLNQIAFRIWKESFQAATRELQRIYGKDLMKHLKSRKCVSCNINR